MHTPLFFQSFVSQVYFRGEQSFLSRSVPKLVESQYQKNTNREDGFY